jgi:hypothetical protein
MVKSQITIVCEGRYLLAAGMAVGNTNATG